MGVPLNGAGFAAEPGYEPTGPGEVFFSLPPLMLALLALLGLALFALGWFLKDAQAPRRADAAESIWKAVDKALETAMKADGGSLAGKAEEVKKTLEKRLGATLALAAGLNGPFKALKTALDGEAHQAADHAHDSHAGHDHKPHDPKPHDQAGHDPHGPGAHAGESHARHEAGPVTQVTIINGAAAGHGGGHGGKDDPHKGDDGHKPAKPAPLSARDRDRALRLAVADLNDHWRHKAERIAELRAAHRELSAD